ncbi:MAG: hypothetical protein Q8N03_04750 [Ignavibacteria bacterium]|nr:hypothetical protein [Ignavibacteria bacterium]
MFSLKKKRIKYLNDNWGKSSDKHRNFDLISSYHNILNSYNDVNFVDEKTWNDLQFDSIFSKLDRNISGIGQQYLYHIMHRYEGDENRLQKRFKMIKHLKGNQQLREKIQISLFGLTGISSYFIANLILNKELPGTKYYPLFYLCSALTFASLLLIAVNGNFLFISLALLLTNLVINKMFSNRVYEYFTGFSSLNSLIISAISIGKLNPDLLIDEIERLKKQRHLLISLKKKLGYLVIDKEALSEFGIVLIEYLNMFFLFDIIAYYRSVNTLFKHQDEIHETFKCVGGLDAYISVASYLQENPAYSIPIFNNSGIIEFSNLYHPLLKGAVSNSLQNFEKSALITGSNMSGKTTFIKTVGINFILSQTLYFSLSSELNIPKLIVKSAIHRNEDLEIGKSYFFVEIETINNFIKLGDNRGDYLFLIDEIFRGTNTIERLASSTAVLKHLDKRNKVLVTTHDIELQELLNNNFNMYHFSEQVAFEKYFFDYKIKEGPCSSGNAIKLLEIMGYPISIINDANLLVRDFLLKNKSLFTTLFKN